MDKTIFFNFIINIWREVLGVIVKILPLPDYVTPEFIEKAKDSGMELTFVPSIYFGTKKQSIYSSAKKCLENLQNRYFNWNISKHKWYWNMLKNGLVPFPKLSGQWAIVEIIIKPKYGEYPPSKITNVLEFRSRFNHSFNEVNNALAVKRKEILSLVGLVDGEVRMLDAVEEFLLNTVYNFNGPSKNFEFINTKASLSNEEEYSESLAVCHNDNDAADNSISVNPETSNPNIGFRVAIFLK